jgi:hypothetical protein
LLEGRGHAFASFPRNETGASVDNLLKEITRRRVIVRERIEPSVIAERIQHGIDSNPGSVGIFVIQIFALAVINRSRFVVNLRSWQVAVPAKRLTRARDYSGVGDGVGEAVSVAGCGFSAELSAAEDGVDG